MPDIEVLDCPFCGATPEKYKDTYDRWPIWFRHPSNECYLSGHVISNENKWNASIQGLIDGGKKL